LFLSVGQQDRRLSQQQIAELYQRTGGLVLRRCNILLRNPAEAEDVLQEVFIRLIRYGDFARADEVPLAWLYRTAERCCFDRMRKRDREPTGIAEDLLNSLALPDAGKKHEAAELLMQFFHKLDPKLKQVALMYYLDGLPQERSAEELNWSRRTVGKKIKKLRQRADRLRARKEK